MSLADISQNELNSGSCQKSGLRFPNEVPAVSVLRRRARRALRPLALMPLLVFALAPLVVVGDDKEEAIKKDRKIFEGTWRVVSLTVEGNKATDEDARKMTMENRLDGTWIFFSEGEEVLRGTSTIDPTKTPKTIDFTPSTGESQGKLLMGIYEIKEDTRRMCFSDPDRERPLDFSSTANDGQILVAFERVRPDESTKPKSGGDR